MEAAADFFYKSVHFFFAFPKCLAQNINSKVYCSDFQVSKNLYLVNKSIDLNGDKLIIPKGMKIRFGLLGSFQSKKES